jgi:hypothetical protein
MSRSSCRVSAVVGLCMALVATATAFVTPRAVMTRKQWLNPASQLFMAADKIEKKETTTETSSSSSSTKSQSQYFFANQASKTNGEPKATSESETAFDPFQVSSDGNQLEPVNINGVGELKQEQDKQELGIWAARGILLLVAAIWGTNFAVRAYYHSFLVCLWLASAGLMFTFFAEPLFNIPISFFFSFSCIVNTTERQIPFRSLLSPAMQPSTVGSSLCSFRSRRLGQFSLACQTKQRSDYGRS